MPFFPSVSAWHYAIICIYLPSPISDGNQDPVDRAIHPLYIDDVIMRLDDPTHERRGSVYVTRPFKD